MLLYSMQWRKANLFISLKTSFLSTSINHFPCFMLHIYYSATSAPLCFYNAVTAWVPHKFLEANWNENKETIARERSSPMGLGTPPHGWPIITVAWTDSKITRGNTVTHVGMIAMYCFYSICLRECILCCMDENLQMSSLNSFPPPQPQLIGRCLHEMMPLMTSLLFAIELIGQRIDRRELRRGAKDRKNWSCWWWKGKVIRIQMMITYFGCNLINRG